jgi:hypothetical protein
VGEAEQDDDVQKNWASLADFVAIGDLAEAKFPFSGFDAGDP